MPYLRVRVVDAFTVEPFRGNPAAVCIVEEALDESLMQAVAREMNLSETAFCRTAVGGSHALRWFTPVCEVDLCGHATLATVHALYEDGLVPEDGEVSFLTGSGPLSARVASDGRVEMTFPTGAVEEGEPPPGLFNALGCTGRYEGAAWKHHVVLVDSERTLASLRPDFRRLATVAPGGVVVTAPSDRSGIDFVSRVFAPGVGVDEDPVTGAAHCILGAYWARITGRQDLVGFQASERGGTVGVRVLGERTVLSGRAVTVFDGVLRLP